MHGMMEPHGLIDMKDISQVNNMDLLEKAVGESPQVECPLEHFFTPEIYTRKIFMPAGTLAVSLKHKTTHPFFILKGKVAVLRVNDHGEFEIEGMHEAGHMGIKAHSKRLSECKNAGIS